ncbi:MAG: hypothetical protein ACLQU1_03535 [Bryobacteraceae bacterium]
MSTNDDAYLNQRGPWRGSVFDLCAATFMSKPLEGHGQKAAKQKINWSTTGGSAAGRSKPKSPAVDVRRS